MTSLLKLLLSGCILVLRKPSGVLWLCYSVQYLFSITRTGEMTFLYLPTSTEANHTLEDMKVAVLKAGLANQEYHKKQEMRLIFNMGLWVLVDF